MKILLQILLIITLTSFRSTNNTFDNCVYFNLQSTSPVDIKIIKNLPNTFINSGVLPTKESENLCKPNSCGFFGRYVLLYRHTTSKEPIFGQLIVYVTGKADSWKFDNSNETFSQLTLTASKIKLWDKIHIGATEKELLNFIGKNFHYKKGISIYTEINEYSLECSIVADTINKIKVSKYCKTKK